jgi:hypothetical protein
VPAALFAAVAQVLAWVYQLRARADVAPPTVDVPPELDPHNQPLPAEPLNERAADPAQDPVRRERRDDQGADGADLHHHGAGHDGAAAAALRCWTCSSPSTSRCR